MVSATIQRILFLLKRLNALKQTPFITGPGALKQSLIHSFGGSGYFDKGTFFGKAHRNMTIIGSRHDAKHAKYVGRSRVRVGHESDEGSVMDMPHYLDGSTRRKELRKYSCRVELMKRMNVRQKKSRI